MAKRSGWRTAGLVAGIGCLSMIVIVVGGVIIASMWARATMANLGDPEPKPVDQRIALPAPVSGGRSATAGEKSAPLRLTIDLQEGFFTIKPGEPGREVQVKGEYAPGLYELVESQDTDPATGVRRASIRFRSKAPAWARFFAGIGGRGPENGPELTVTIPRGSPIDLTLHISMGRSEVDLGGLTLGEVDVNASMGEHRIDFREPVVEGLTRLRFSNSMGNVEIENLGNARANAISASGSMGNVTANLGGAWPAGEEAELTFEHSMGDLTLRVPSNVKLDADVRNSDGETQKQPGDTTRPDDPTSPTLKVRVTTSMGNARVIRY